MKKTDGIHDVHDSDLQQLFRKQGQPPSPEDLDLRILAAATEAVKPENNAPATGQSGARTWHKGFAVAALLMLSVSIVPMLSRFQNTEMPAVMSDESAVLRTEKLAIDNAAMRSKSSDLAESAGAMRAPAARAVQNATEMPQPAAESFSATPAKSMAKPVQQMEMSESLPQTEAVDEAHALSETALQKSGFGYREYPESWMTYIKALEKDNRLEEARLEQLLFDKAFPDFTQSDSQ